VGARGVWLGALAWWALAGCHTYTTIYGDDAGTCVAPRSICGIECVDTSTDSQNCGACGVACPSNSLCFGSACAPCPTTSTLCGLGGAPYCANLENDSANCGACGKACPQGTVCQQGSCACPLTQCGALCTDTQTDSNNCGTCGHTCTTSLPNELAVCVAGACVPRCALGYDDCNGVGGDGCEANLATDSANCGACGRSCGADACASGMCPAKVVAAGLSGPHSLSVDGGYVYFATQSEVDRVPVGGGSVETLVTTPAAATRVATDGTYIAWGVPKNEVDARLTSGGTVTVLSSNTSFGGGLALAGGDAYFTLSNQVMRAPLDGSSQAQVVALASATDLALDGTTLFLVQSGAIVSAPMNGQSTPASTLYFGSALHVAVDSTQVYWTESSSNVLGLPKGGGKSFLVAAAQNGADAIAADGLHVYWTTSAGDVRRTFSGEPVLTLATGQSPPSSIAVDATTVYWSTQTSIVATVK
jgi:hypothetical protein